METNNYQQELQSLALHLEYIARMCPDKLEEAMSSIKSLNNSLKLIVTTYGN